ncbi:class I SAM-dependent methyltransferase [Cellulomonas fimi]|uniref:Class I SAM-dependent methyltransferase n=1 Tax=Cellulomonas fimi TaxID=1708 RepID=A0A7Y0QGJ2_CELFI|nr:class I SAM-dependent methyltransferase [Cellulomonas fimi]NMR18944.1 class I SAM-dependent methyltransferase [Cellulomonas fimi]
MAGEFESGWSAVAGEWAELWGPFAAPVRDVILAVSRAGPGSRVLDVGCGSGELLAQVAALGATGAGIDPAPGMVELARRRAPEADVRLGRAEHLPWDDGAFDVVVAVNSLQLADSALDALAEAVRVVAPGGLVAVASWAEAVRNDLTALEAAVAAAAEEELPPDGELRAPGGLESLLDEAGLELVTAGLVHAPWEVPDDDTLVRGVLLGEDGAGIAAARRTVLEAARPFGTASGGYRLVNALRYAVGRTPV